MTNSPDSPKLLADRLAGLSPTKRALLELKLRQSRANLRQDAADLRPIEPRPRRGPVPLSFAQQRLWFLDQLDPASPLYYLRRRIKLHGHLDDRVLQRALEGLVARHESLRTTFPTLGGRPAQEIHPAGRLELPLVDLSPLEPEQREAEAQSLTEDEARRPFDLAQGPLIRARLLRLAEQEHVLLLTVHHIVSDGWSMGVLFRELGELYEALVHARPAALPELPIQYADYAVWQHERFAGALLESELAYWKARFPTVPPPLQLPAKQACPRGSTGSGTRIAFTLADDLTRRLKALGHQEGATLFMTLLAGFKALLARYTGQEDVVVGSPIAGRPRAETEGLVGFFTNMLALRTDLSGDPTFRQLLGRVRETALGAYAHQELPFERLVEELQPERDLSRNPIFQVMFAVQNIPRAELHLPGLTLLQSEVGAGAAKFDLGLVVLEEGDALRGLLSYDDDRFDAATVERLAGHYTQLLTAAAADPTRPLSTLPLVTPRERHELLVTWNSRPGRYQLNRCVHQLFEAQAARTPERIAAVSDRGQLTYLELNAKANQVARGILARQAVTGSYVPIVMEGGLPVVIAMLGAMKAGVAFVPVDVNWPTERIQRILDELDSGVLLTTASATNSEALRGRSLYLVDEEAWGGSTANLNLPTDPEAPIYAFYTSGSTGAPKAAIVPHRGVTNRFLWMNEFFGADTAAAALQTTRHVYDSAVWQLLWPLINGGKTIIPAPGMELNAEYLSLLIATHSITIADFVPSVFNVLVPQLVVHGPICEQLASLRAVIIGGEEITPATTYRFMARFPDVRVVNLYGPTEASIGCICYEVTGTEGGRIPIGRPISNVGTLVLDAHGGLVPVGVAGELHLAGACVGLGYLKDAEKTQAAFSSSGFAEMGPGKTYRTGDLVRYRADGQLEFLGRVDRQVKLRGHRIELGEIESALGRNPDVLQSLVTVWEHSAGEKRLVAYVVPGQWRSPSVHELRAWVKQSLPEYMVPSAVVLLQELPLLPSGKVDHRALPPPDTTRGDLQAACVAPRTPVEEVLVGLWSDLLQLERVGVEDNFFELGGHSLLATQIVARVRATFGVDLPLRALFEEPTVAGLARRLERSQPGPALPPLVRVSHDQQLPLSLAQQRLWFLHRLEPESPFYSIPLAVRLSGKLVEEALARALDALVMRHELLRATFPEVDGVPVQDVSPGLHLPLVSVDLSTLSPQNGEAEAWRAVGEEARRPFDLAQGPLIRARLLRLGEQEHVLLLTVHHIVSDGWSIGVLFRELGELYEALVHARPAALPELPIQYADYAVWQHERFAGALLESELAYWRTQLAGAAPALELPSDRPRPPIQRYRGAKQSFLLPLSVSEKLRRLGHREGATLFMTLLAGFKALLARYTGQEDVVVGSPIAGRSRAETEGLVGCFVNTLVLRTDLSGDPTFRQLLGRVRETALGAYAHQELPFERLVEELQPERDLSRNPIFQVMFAVQNTLRVPLDLPALSVSRLPVKRGTSKFDLAMVVREDAGALRGVVTYSTDLFDAATMERLVGHYTELLTAVALDPAQPLSALPILTEVEQERLLLEWNATDREYPRDRCVQELFEQQVARSPEATAVTFGDERLTYRDLNRSANRLAHHLRKLGVSPETPVGLCLERSFDLAIAILGIIKAGGAYVPLDPLSPPDRSNQLLADSRATVLVTTTASLPAIRPVGCVVVALDQNRELIACESGEDLESGLTPENLAYVIYTSGSTGAPKGVAVPHRAVVNLSFAASRAYGIEAGDRVLQFSASNSDFSVEELFPTWLSGAAVVLRAPGPPPTGAEFRLAIELGRVSILALPTAFWHSWVADLQLSRAALPDTLRLVTIGGERARPAAAAAWRELGHSKKIRWFNTYGPTETTVEATLHEPTLSAVGSATGAELPIGRPMANVQVYVLDRLLRPVPVGVPGELYIGGDGLARGYLGGPGLTAERFVPNRFGGEPGSRLYRTGDRVRYLPDGNLEFLGRLDHQVKIRGFRVELGEIEALLADHPGVREAVVLAPEDAIDDRRLVAYLVPASEGPSTEELVAFLKRQLPEHMVPSSFVILDALPLTPTGKVDRRALPAPERFEHDLGERFVAPRSLIEQTIANIWGTVLRLEHVGVEDNFFAIGGHSLLATQVVARVRTALGIELPLRAFFEVPTVAGLAERIAAALRLADEEAPTVAGSADRLASARRTPSAPQIPPLVRLPREAHSSVGARPNDPLNDDARRLS